MQGLGIRDSGFVLKARITFSSLIVLAAICMRRRPAATDRGAAAGSARARAAEAALSRLRDE